MRSILLMVLLAALSGCSLLGPPSLNYSRSDIEQRAFIDRKAGGWGELFKGLDQSFLTGPEVGFMTASQRIELAWTARLPDAPAAFPLSLRIAISGTPKLSASKQGIDLADARVEELSMPAIPFFNLLDAKMRQGSALGYLPLLQFESSELRRDGVVYEPAELSLGMFGLKVKLVPK